MLKLLNVFFPEPRPDRTESAARALTALGTQVAMPARLAARLAAIPQALLRRAPKPLPLWITDLRFAAAGCALATALIVSMLGSPSELVALADLWAQKTAVWQTEGEQSGRLVLGLVAGRLGSTLAQGKESFTTYGRLWRKLIDESAHTFVPRNLTDQLERYFSSQGDDHGQPSSNV